MKSHFFTAPFLGRGPRIATRDQGAASAAPLKFDINLTIC